MAIWDSIFGGSDPYDEAAEYLDKIEPMLRGIYDPYVDYGMRAMPTLEEQYAMLLSDPGALYSMMGQGFESSPGYQFQLDQAMNAANQSAAAGGMAGTPAHQQQAMGYAQGLAGQDYQNYMNQMMNLYGRGLSGTEGQLQTGYGAGNQLASGLSGLYGSQANLASSQAAAQNKQLASLLGGIGGAALSGGWF